MPDSDDLLQVRSIETLAVHLRYMRDRMDEMSGTMAKKQDIEALKMQLEGYATTRETDLLKVDIADLRKQLAEITRQVAETKPSSLIAKIATVATQVMAIIGVVVLVVSMFANGVRLADALPDVKVTKP